MQHIATGPLSVTMTPAAPADRAGVVSIEQLVLAKAYRGALNATGAGHMLTAMTDTKGSAAYVAIERISGTLDGRSGSFVVQHAGTMFADPAAGPGGASEVLAIAIVPDSGAGELAGIAGTLRIMYAGSEHAYELRYALPAL